jgi:hypothetical protein
MSQFRVEYTCAETGSPVVRLVDAMDRHHAAAIVYPASDERETVQVEEVSEDFVLERGPGVRG